MHHRNLFAACMVGVCPFVPSVQAEVHFSAWPICDFGGSYVPGLVSSGVDTGDGIDGWGVFQPIPAKVEAWNLSEICFAASFVNSAGLDLPVEDLPTSGWVIGYLGQPPPEGGDPGSSAFSIPILLPASEGIDTGYRTGMDAVIWRVCVSIPTEAIPASEVLSIAVVAELDAAVGYMVIHESAMVDPSVPDAWYMNFSTGLNEHEGFFGDCDGIAAYQLYGLPGDLDDDGDVDLADYATFEGCLVGPDVLTPPGGCTQEDFYQADMDHDGDVDLGDFSEFQEAFE